MTFLYILFFSPKEHVLLLALMVMWHVGDVCVDHKFCHFFFTYIALSCLTLVFDTLYVFFLLYALDNLQCVWTFYILFDVMIDSMQCLMFDDLVCFERLRSSNLVWSMSRSCCLQRVLSGAEGPVRWLSMPPLALAPRQTAIEHRFCQ